MTDEALFHWSALTHSGSRKIRNDDSLTVFASGSKGAELLPLTGSRSLATQDLVFAVSDGMGGGNAGDLASRLILEQMSLIIPETFKTAASGLFPDCLSHLTDALRAVHAHINEAAVRPEHQGMAATLALAWFTPDNLYLANVGDSRIYLSRAGVLTLLTRDHSSAFGQWARGEITEIQFRTHPRRSALYEVVGGGHAAVCPHFAAVPYQPGDRFLICTDGLIDGVWERHIGDALARCAPSRPEDTTQTLARRAITNSGVDDTTLITVTITAAA
ncbi:MAG: serine/threonine-protein phosphatase [Akkermansiaceae bacterium]|jgi:protein phosphatase|nr:serine/threonine-protein phosphatase [Akkermansiaceae bacterium]